MADMICRLCTKGNFAAGGPVLSFGRWKLLLDANVSHEGAMKLC